MSNPIRYAEGMTGDQVCDSLGILPRKLRRWIKTGLVRPSVNKSGGGKLADGAPNRNIFSRTDWLELKTIAFLRQAHVGLKKAKKVIDCIRQQNHSLGPGVAHQVGRVIWLRGVIVVGEPFTQSPQPWLRCRTVFLEWDDLVRQAESEFKKYSGPYLTGGLNARP